MIYPGTDIKFRITATQSDFQLSEDFFEIVIKDHHGRIRKTITKSDCFWDEQGNWYFLIDDARKSIYYAHFYGRYEDEDFDDQHRDFYDVQELCRVGYRGTPIPCKCKHVIQYEQVYTVSIDGEDYLADCDGKYILTSDGKRICFKNDKAQEIEDMGKVRMQMTGEEFLQKWEGRDQNGEINTVPELMDAAKGISEDKTIKEEIQEEVEESDVERVTPEDLDNFEV